MMAGLEHANFVWQVFLRDKVKLPLCLTKYHTMKKTCV